MTIDFVELAERVGKATGGSRELDAALAAAFESDLYPTWMTGPMAAGTDNFIAIPRYTASIDAALGLVERLLPGWIVDHIGADAAGMRGKMRTLGWSVDLHDGVAYHQGQSPTLPLAIISALLAALKSLSEKTNAVE